MKKNVFYSFIMLFYLLFSSACTDDTPIQDNPQEQPVEETRYYVKYEVKSKFGNRVFAKQNIVYTTDTGSQNYSQESYSTTSFEWEGTYGPFKKGDAVKLEVSNSIMDISGRIYVSRDKEPFVIKAEGSGKKILSLQYSIDF